MKILYTANERTDAQLAATALRSVAEDVTVTWAGRLYDAGTWISDNEDLAALVVEDQVQHQSCAAFVGHVRRLGLTIPIVVVAPEDAGPPLAALKAGADDYVVKNESLLPNLTAVVSRTLRRAQVQAESQPRRVLYVGDAALARECLARSRCSIEIAEAAPHANGRFHPISWDSAGKPFPFDVLLVEHEHPGVDAFAILRDVIERQLPIAVIFVVEWDEAIVIPALKLGASECVVKTNDSFRAFFFRLDRRHREHVSRAQSAAAQVSDAQWQAIVERERTNREAVEQKLAESSSRLAQVIRSREVLVERVNQAGQALRQAQDDRAMEGAAAAEQLSRREVELAAVKAEGVAIRDQLERQLAERQSEHDTALARLSAERDALEQRLTVAEAAVERAEHARTSEAASYADLLAQQRDAFALSLAHAAETRDALQQEAAETRDTLERRLGEAEAARHEAVRLSADERLDAEQRQAQFEAQIAREVAARQAVEHDLAECRQQLAEQESARRDADERHASVMATAATRSAERQAELETRLADAASAHATLEQTVAETEQRFDEAEAALERVRRERAAEAIAAAERLTQLETELAGASANVERLERRLADAETALQAAAQHAVSERLASAEHAIRRQAEFDARLARELGTRHGIEQTLAATRQQLVHAEAARRDAEQQHASAMTTAAAQLAEQQRQYEASLAQGASAREAVDQRLCETEAALERVRQESTADATAATTQLAQREAELAAAVATRQDLEQRLAQTETALENAEARALAERTAAAQQAALRSEEFDSRLAQEIEARQTVEREFFDTRAAAERAQQTFLDELAGQMQRMREVETRLGDQLAREQADYESKLADREEQLRSISVERDALHQSLVTAQQQLQELSRVHEADRADALQTLERVTSEHAAELARVNRLVAERDGELRDLAARHVASQETARQALTKLQTKLRAALDARSRQVDQLQGELDALVRERDALRQNRDALKLEADRVPQLTSQLDASRAENRRQFEEHPVGMLRCSRKGELLDANRALINRLGYRTIDDLRALDIPAAVFESAEDLQHLIERSQSTRRTPVVAIWKNKYGSRLHVRLHAATLFGDVVQIVAEDLTRVRVLEERLRQSERMEAVGRLASEVAVTCDTLLRDVSDDGRQWLATVGHDTAQRQQGELIFGEVTRAATLLRQLSLYGDQQASALEPVDIGSVLRDMEPVLKRVAGADVESAFPQNGSPLNVDIDAERVERVLVNVAAYGRARMPSGGRLIVDLARVTVDPNFVAKYPNVRQGAHALITVKEVRDGTRAEWSIGSREPAERTRSEGQSERPGVDLGTLQALIRDCEGHLWMNAEPGGEMEVKIHLPLRPEDTSTLARVVRARRARPLGRWFQS